MTVKQKLLRSTAPVARIDDRPKSKGADTLIPQATTTIPINRARAISPARQSSRPRKGKSGDDGGDGDGDGEPPRPIKHHLDRRADVIAEAVAAAGDDDDLLTTVQVANWFCVSPQWLEIGRMNGYGPPFVRVAPQVVRYRRGTMKEWLRERSHASTGEYASNRKRVEKPHEAPADTGPDLFVRSHRAANPTRNNK